MFRSFDNGGDLFPNGTVPNWTLTGGLTDALRGMARSHEKQVADHAKSPVNFCYLWYGGFEDSGHLTLGWLTLARRRDADSR